MSRIFSALADRVAAAAPNAWPGGSGSIFVRIQPIGWASGAGAAHAFWTYGFDEGAAGRSLLSFQRGATLSVYVGWVGDAANGGEQRLIVPDAGCFADGVWANHLFTWDDKANAATYYVDNAQIGVRSASLRAQALAGQPSSSVNLGNVNAASGNADARSALAFFARWSRVLSDVERTQLQSGAHPLDIPTGLVECVDLGAGSPERDFQSGVTYAVSGTTVGDDPSRAPSEVRRIAQKFEPILLFHPNEPFFPVDPKWYLERASLWPAIPSFTDKTSWGDLPGAAFPHGPRLARNQLAALAGDASSSVRWLGDPAIELGTGFTPDQETPPPEKEFFLDFASWEGLAPPDEVTATSINRHAALDPGEYAGPLTDGRPWYYVEYLDDAQLATYAANHRVNGLDLANAVVNNPMLGAPRALLYYFLYPLHQEALEHCTKDEGLTFATYAGEWSCIAVLLDSTETPRFIGLTTRNVGAPNRSGTEDARVAMAAFAWTAASTVGGADASQHPRIYVSLGTHGNYLSPGAHTVTPFMGGNDYSRGSCGAVEGVDDVIASDIVIPGDPGHPWPSTSVVIAKSLLPIVGWIWAGLELSEGHFGTADELTYPGSTATDQTGGPMFGRILRPDGLAFDETASASGVQDWNVKRYAAADGRVYDSVVSRAAQVWWTPRRKQASAPEGLGWFGRWGPRVTNDPFNRRAGGKCPDFVALFLEAIAIALAGS